jgi:hypothetical protein
MPRGKVNKAAKIREMFAKLGPQVRPKDVIATLAAEKINVSSAQVSNIKATLNGHGRPGRKMRGKPGSLTLADLEAAKRLVDVLGSPQRAEAAIAALAKLM